MPVFVSLLRGVNVGGHNKIKMDALRALYESLQLREAQTYVQSGNVVFKTEEHDRAELSDRIGSAIERSFGFRPAVILRACSELKSVVDRNPFATRRDITPSKLLVTFLASDPGQESREKVLKIKTDPEELRVVGSELYVYFPNGMGRSKLPFSVIEKALEVPGTSRNWNSVTKLLEIAQRLER